MVRPLARLRSVTSKKNRPRHRIGLGAKPLRLSLRRRCLSIRQFPAFATDGATVIDVSAWMRLTDQRPHDQPLAPRQPEQPVLPLLEGSRC